MNQYPTNFSRVLWIAGAAVLGAAAMYIMDPVQGNRRRALARDKVRSASIQTRKTIDATSRDLSNRAHGLRTEVSRMMPKRNRQASSQSTMW